MPCYHPLIGVPELGSRTVNGKIKYRILSSKLIDSPSEMPFGSIMIPCGHCIGCKLDYSRYWADRMMLELDVCKKGIFITLTYDNEHAHWTQFDENNMPMFATLDKRDCQLFMKNLRERFNGIKIRFYLAGEYGPSTLRPHYHAILFGIDRDDIGDCKEFGKNELGQKYYKSDRLASIWKNGYVLLSDVSWKTCAYVARYVTKKLNGKLDNTYAERNVFKEFALMSRKPGIGKPYLDAHPDCMDYSYINIGTEEEGKKITIPKYFLKKLELENPEKYDKIVSDRKKFANDSMMLQLGKTDLKFVQYLENQEYLKIQKLSGLRDGKV